MLQAEFFTGYTAGQLTAGHLWQRIVGDELCLTSPLYWGGGQVMGSFNTCLDPATGEVYPWCGVGRATINILNDWADALLLCPDEGGKAWQGLRFWPGLVLARLDELKDTVDREVEKGGLEALIDSPWVGYRLAEIRSLEKFLASL